MLGGAGITPSWADCLAAGMTAKQAADARGRTVSAANMFAARAEVLWPKKPGCPVIEATEASIPVKAVLRAFWLGGSRRCFVPLRTTEIADKVAGGAWPRVQWTMQSMLHDGLVTSEKVRGGFVVFSLTEAGLRAAKAALEVV